MFTLASIDRHTTDSEVMVNLYRNDYRFADRATFKHLPLASLPDTHRYLGAQFNDQLEPVSSPQKASIWPCLITLSEIEL